ncbi:MAG: hypothetical protein K0Q68_1983 [Moraxellaceae bacterium]|jgi:hypothetical protein|nr:hypothetical protein [Moraxellaceae bacterium]
MKKNYVLIDYENVQPDAVAALVADHFHVLVFVGASQTKVTYEVASSLQKLGERATYIKISGNGSNALDFHIAYYIGRLAEKEPDAYFHIVSKDTGFDPLIQHLKSQKILSDRVKGIPDLPVVKLAASKFLPDRVSAVVANLAQRQAAHPRTLKTLSSTINALFQKSLSQPEVDGIISELTKKDIISVKEGKVSYALPSES